MLFRVKLYLSLNQLHLVTLNPPKHTYMCDENKSQYFKPVTSGDSEPKQNYSVCMHAMKTKANIVLSARCIHERKKCINFRWNILINLRLCAPVHCSVGNIVHKSKAPTWMPGVQKALKLTLALADHCTTVLRLISGCWTLQPDDLFYTN